MFNDMDNCSYIVTTSNDCVIHTANYSMNISLETLFCLDLISKTWPQFTWVAVIVKPHKKSIRVICKVTEGVKMAAVWNHLGYGFIFVILWKCQLCSGSIKVMMYYFGPRVHSHLNTFLCGSIPVWFKTSLKNRIPTFFRTDSNFYKFIFICFETQCT